MPVLCTDHHQVLYVFNIVFRWGIYVLVNVPFQHYMYHLWIVTFLRKSKSLNDIILSMNMQPYYYIENNMFCLILIFTLFGLSKARCQVKQRFVYILFTEAFGKTINVICL
jgi:hypothetical protein